MFIVIDGNSNSAIGNTLQEAFDNYEKELDTLDMNDCTWFEADELKVQQKIEKVEKVTITKTPNKK